MNRGEIRTAVKERLAIPSIGDGLLPDSTLNSLINRSLATISAAKEWPWLLDTYTMNTYKYSNSNTYKYNNKYTNTKYYAN